jgi:hypothetical protein
MHYSKSYAALLQSLPSELRANALEYRALKKLVNQVAGELDTLGLGPDVLARLLTIGTDEDSLRTHGVLRELGPDENWTQLEDLKDILGESSELKQVLYEFGTRDGLLEPHLRLHVGPKSFSTEVDHQLPHLDVVEPSSIAGPSTLPLDAPP